MYRYEDAVEEASALLAELGIDDAKFDGRVTVRPNGERWLSYTTGYNLDNPVVVAEPDGAVRLEPWTYSL